jgi:hypothetical protein
MNQMLHHTLNGLFGRQLLQGHHGLVQFARIRDRQLGQPDHLQLLPKRGIAGILPACGEPAVMVRPTLLRKVMHV